MPTSKFDAINEAQNREAVLELLDIIQNEDMPSQRKLSKRMGVALGLTNALVKRCVRKGWLKISEAPAKRYLYYLTPSGFREKSALTAEYLSHSLRFFTNARDQYVDAIDYCRARGWENVALCGAGDLAEIAVLSAHNADFRLRGVIDARRNVSEFLGYEVYSSLSEMVARREIDAIIMTCAESPQEKFDALRQEFDEARILTPLLLRVWRGDVQEEG